MTRAEKVAEAQRLRGEGLLLREIAERMGASISTVDGWVNDPDLSKQRARREGYRGRCEVCGAATNGSNGPARPPERCIDCERDRYGERNARIFAAWGRGETATTIAAREGMTVGAVGALIDRHRRRGVGLALHRRRNRELWPLIERRWGEGATSVEIAAGCGTTRENIEVTVRAMRKAGIDLPYRHARKAAA